MYEQINKWVVIFCCIFEIFYKFELYDMTIFFFYHYEAAVDIILKSVTGGIGQIFIYQLIKNFRQHVVPFTVTLSLIHI